MDSPQFVAADAPWSEPGEQRRLFMVNVTATCEDGGEPFASRALPPELSGWCSPGQLTVWTTVLALTASAAVEALVPELAGAASATVTAHAPSEAEELSAQGGLARLRETVERATDEDRARVARMMAHVEAQRAQHPESHR